MFAAESDEPVPEREPQTAGVLLVPPRWPPAPPGTGAAPGAPGAPQSPQRRQGIFARLLRLWRALWQPADRGGAGR